MKKEKIRFDSCGLKFTSLIMLMCCLLLLTSCSERMSFNQGDSQEFEFNELTCYVPSDWHLYDYDESPIGGAIAEQDATYSHKEYEEGWDVWFSIEYFGEFDDFDDFEEGLDVVKENWYNDDDSYTEITVPGCSKAFEMGPYNENDEYVEEIVEMTKYGRLIYSGNSIFLISFSCRPDFFVQEECDEMMDAIDFENYAQYCEAEDCNNIAKHGHQYCEECECIIPECTGRRMNDSPYCPEDYLSSYEGTEEVSDYGEIFGLTPMKTVDLDIGTGYVYEYSREDEEKVDAYIKLLKAKGFKKKDTVYYMKNEGVIIDKGWDSTSDTAVLAITVTNNLAY